MSTRLVDCINKIETAYNILLKSNLDSTVQRSLATAFLIYSLQSESNQIEKTLEIVKHVIPNDEIAEIMEDQEFEHGDFYLLLPLYFILRSLTLNSSIEMFQGINNLIEAANCLNDEHTYDFWLNKINPLENDDLFLELLEIFLKINHKLFPDDLDDLKPEEVLEITKALGIEYSLTYISTFKQAARIANSIMKDNQVSLEEQSSIFIMALKAVLSTEEDIKLAIVFAKVKEYEFAKEF